MDTTAKMIFSRLNTNDLNTALILTDTFKQNVAHIQNSLPEVNVLFAPMSLYHPQFLSVLKSMGVGITCSNQELLDNVQEIGWEEGTIIGNEFISRSFIRAAYGAGCSRFTVSSLAEMQRIEACVEAGNVEFIVQVGVGDNSAELWQSDSSTITGLVVQGALDTAESVAEKGALLHSALQQARAGGHVIQHVILGSLTCATPELLDSISSLRSSLLPEGAKMHLLLDQQFLDSSLFIATKIIHKETQDAGVKYVVDLSLYEELMCYMDTPNEINAVPHTPHLLFGSIHGNSGEEDDLLCSGVVGSHEVGDWVLLANIALVQGSEWELLLVDNVPSSEPEEQFPLCEHVTPCHMPRDITMATCDITMTARDITLTARDITMATRDLLMEQPRLSEMFTAGIQVSV